MQSVYETKKRDKDMQAGKRNDNETVHTALQEQNHNTSKLTKNIQEGQSSLNLLLLLLVLYVALRRSGLIFGYVRCGQ